MEAHSKPVLNFTLDVVLIRNLIFDLTFPSAHAKVRPTKGRSGQMLNFNVEGCFYVSWLDHRCNKQHNDNDNSNL